MRRDHPNKDSMKYDVYILFSKNWKRYYVGQTQDIEKRFKRHNDGFVPSTKGGLPWKLVVTFSVTSRSEAMKLELKIKKRGIKRFLEDNQFGV